MDFEKALLFSLMSNQENKVLVDILKIIDRFSSKTTWKLFTVLHKTAS